MEIDNKHKEIYEQLTSGETDNTLLLPIEFDGVKTSCICAFMPDKNGNLILWPISIMISEEFSEKIKMPEGLGNQIPVEEVDIDDDITDEEFQEVLDKMKKKSNEWTDKDWVLKEIDGDLIDLAMKGEFDIIIHGANCHHIMGAGIAGQIARVFPEAYEADKKTILGEEKLGTYSLARIIDKDQELDITVINAYTQNLPGRNLNYEALEEVLTKLADTLEEGSRIGIPEIGCGIAGGEWEEVKKIIEDTFVGHDITVVHFKPISNDPLDSIEPLKK